MTSEKTEKTEGSASLEEDENPPDDEDERMWAALSFVIILIIIGIPLWWKMTEVERSYFPYDEIAELKFQNVTFQLEILVSTMQTDTSDQIISDLEDYFIESSLFYVNFKTVAYRNEIYNKSIIELEEISQLHHNTPNFIQLMEATSLDTDITIGRHRTIYIKKDTNSKVIYKFLQDILQEQILKESIKAVTFPGYTSENLDYLRKLRPSPTYDMIFTIVNPQPEKIKFEWNSQIFIEHSFQPLLEQLSELSEFRLKSQWLYLVDLQQTPQKVDDHYELNQKQVPHIITPLEKKIGSGVTKNPCINFVLYITKCEHSPMVFIDEEKTPTNAILSARWGGVQLLNPDKLHCEEQQPFKVNSKQIMQTFLVQFKKLIGLNNFSFDDKVIKLHNEEDIYPWQLDGLHRMRILEQFISARITLTSLSQLLGEISNIVITMEVGNAVLKSVNSIKNTLESLENKDLLKALNFSTQSFVSSEFAFTHPSLLALLYFPDDQKYAVYIPLYLPVMIPVLLSLKNIHKWLNKRFRNSFGQRLETE